jgi:polysaccharide export outer membrane protein
MPALTQADNYRVGGGDVLKITVYDNPDLDTVARVNSDGNIIFPLIGEVHVSGETTSGIARAIAGKLADGYIINPQVSVFIQEFKSKKVVIVGQVEKPGMHELSGPTTLLELISKAEGLKKNAGGKIIIKRKGEGKNEKKIISIDLKQLMEEGDPSLNILLQDGDNIYVPKAGYFYVTGEVEKPNSYLYEKDMTVMKAIAMAGGFTDIASKGGVYIIRKKDGKETKIEDVSMHEKILPDDIIVVPESFF